MTSSPRCAPTTPTCANATAIAAPANAWSRLCRPAPTTSSATGAHTRRRHRSNPASPCSTTSTCTNCCRSSTGHRSSKPGNYLATIRRFSTTPWSARRHGNCSPMHKPCCTCIVDEKWLRAKAVIGFWPANRIGDDVEVYRESNDPETRVPLTTLHHSAPAGRQTRRTPEPVPRRFHRAERFWCARLDWRLRRHRGIGHRGTSRTLPCR